MAAISRAALKTGADSAFNDNTAGDISAADLRGWANDMADSARITADDLVRLINADLSHSNDTTVKNWFNTAGSLTIPAVGTYFFEGVLRLAHGANTHTTSLIFGGTATVTFIEYFSLHSPTALNSVGTLQHSKWNSAASAQIISATGTPVEEIIQIQGLVRFSAVGTFIPQFNYSAAPGTTTQTKRGTLFRMEYLGDESFNTRGSWA